MESVSQFFGDAYTAVLGGPGDDDDELEKRRAAQRRKAEHLRHLAKQQAIQRNQQRENRRQRRPQELNRDGGEQHQGVVEVIDEDGAIVRMMTGVRRSAVVGRGGPSNEAGGGASASGGASSAGGYRNVVNRETILARQEAQDRDRPDRDRDGGNQSSGASSSSSKSRSRRPMEQDRAGFDQGPRPKAGAASSRPARPASSSSSASSSGAVRSDGGQHVRSRPTQRTGAGDAKTNINTTTRTRTSTREVNTTNNRSPLVPSRKGGDPRPKHMSTTTTSPGVVPTSSSSSIGPPQGSQHTLEDPSPSQASSAQQAAQGKWPGAVGSSSGSTGGATPNKKQTTGTSTPTPRPDEKNKGDRMSPEEFKNKYSWNYLEKEKAQEYSSWNPAFWVPAALKTTTTAVGTAGITLAYGLGNVQRALTGDALNDQTLMRAAISGFLRLNGISVTVSYPKNEDAESLTLSPFMVCNHISNVDGMVVTSELDYPRVMAKLEIRSVPMIGDYMNDMGAIWVERESADGRSAAMKAIQDHIDWWRPGKKSMLVFPEGSTTSGNSVGEFKNGIFRPGLPVRPIVLLYFGATDLSSPMFKIDPGTNQIEEFTDKEWLTSSWLQSGFTSVLIKVLRIYHPNEQERKDATLFATNVQQYMKYEYDRLRRKHAEYAKKRKKDLEYYGLGWTVQDGEDLVCINKAVKGHNFRPYSDEELARAKAAIITRRAKMRAEQLEKERKDREDERLKRHLLEQEKQVLLPQQGGQLSQSSASSTRSRIGGAGGGQLGPRRGLGSADAPRTAFFPRQKEQPQNNRTSASVSVEQYLGTTTSDIDGPSSRPRTPLEHTGGISGVQILDDERGGPPPRGGKQNKQSRGGDRDGTASSCSKPPQVLSGQELGSLTRQPLPPSQGAYPPQPLPPPSFTSATQLSEKEKTSQKLTGNSLAEYQPAPRRRSSTASSGFVEAPSSTVSSVEDRIVDAADQMFDSSSASQPLHDSRSLGFHPCSAASPGPEDCAYSLSSPSPDRYDEEDMEKLFRRMNSTRESRLGELQAELEAQRKADQEA
ncbi:unnamed protein product [Amoebophrya sp. A25]|nr:unnamed protein product [Amoebophrya sp. A25]|eukprot:GSA25T00009683001.1